METGEALSLILCTYKKKQEKRPTTCKVNVPCCEPMQAQSDELTAKHVFLCVYFFLVAFSVQIISIGLGCFECGQAYGDHALRQPCGEPCFWKTRTIC